VSGRNRDSTLSFFRSLIDLIECLERVALDSLGQDVRDSCRQSGLAMVNVTDGTDVYMRLGSVKMLFCHDFFPPITAPYLSAHIFTRV
jgi:hypothetical protein